MYNYAIFDPRPGSAAQEANEKIFASGRVMGIEVTIPALAERCLLGNIDPQHGLHAETYNNGSSYMDSAPSSTLPGETAIEFATRQRLMPSEETWIATMLPPEGAVLATVRADLDAIGAMAVLSILARGESLEPAKERIALVACADKFAHGDWSPKPLPTRDNPWPREAATAESRRELVAMAAADFRVPIATRVAWMETWLLTGEEPGIRERFGVECDADVDLLVTSDGKALESYRGQVERERRELISALESGAIKYETRSGGKIAVVESTHRAATSVGYSLAPVVIARNPAFKLGGGEAHVKYTVCAFEAKFADIKSALAELNELEPGWGGSPTIGGSPQGASSQLSIDEVVAVVAGHLR